MRKGKESGKVFPGKCGCMIAEYDVYINTLPIKKRRAEAAI